MSRDIDMEEKTPLDLEAYAANYRGQMKVLRLQQIARTSSAQTLKSDALRMAYTEVKNNTQNVDSFLKICQLAKEAAVQGCEEDHPWCNNAVSESDVLKKRLEADLNAAKANNIRESIRQSSMDLGMYYFDRSDYVSASKMFMRTRDHCSNNVQMLDFCIAVIKTYVLTQNWPMVSTYVGKAEGILVDPKTDRQKQVQAQMHAVAGLADLSLSRYRQAAMSFSKVGSDLGNSFDDVVASIDVARYGVLTALATHDRTAIRTQFLNSPTFSTHLECMLEARELLEAICTSRFAEAFRILDDMKPALQMDPFLSNHLARLTHHIRCRVLQQYTKPFHSLRLSDMAQALGCHLDDLEVELARLIVDDTINARIDSHNKVLYRKMTDERTCTIETVVKAVDDYIATAHSLLLRAELAKCNLKPVGGMEAMGSVDIDYDGAHEGISAEIGGFPSSMIVDGLPAAPPGMGR